MTINHEQATLLNSIYKKVKVVGFDLDDTLWNNRPIITAAINAQFNYLEKQLPKIARAELETVFTVRVEELVSDEPTLYQDISLLRQHALDQLCLHFKLALSHSKAAYRNFFEARQKVTLFDATEPLLKTLSSRYKLVAISNGNATLSTTNINNYFHYHWRAGVNGKAKPDKDMLIKTCEHFSIESAELLYIGDHLEYDYLAAKNAGSFSVILSDQVTSWINDDSAVFFKDIEDFLQATKACLTN